MRYLDYIPLEKKEIKEYIELDRTGNVELGLLDTSITHYSNNQRLSTLEEDGIEYYEKIMGIDKKQGATLEERRAVIIATANNELPYTLRVLQGNVRGVLGNDNFEVILDNNTYTVTIYVYLVNKDKIDAIDVLLKTIIPANMQLRVSVKYNSYNYFKRYTYNELKLKGWSYKYMKEHVFED